jgi:hypothetical protein
MSSAERHRRQLPSQVQVRARACLPVGGPLTRRSRRAARSSAVGGTERIGRAVYAGQIWHTDLMSSGNVVGPLDGRSGQVYKVYNSAEI